MAIYPVIRFDANDECHVVKDDFTGTEITSVKYYYIQMLTSDVTIYFKFDTYILAHTIVKLFLEPTVSANGRALTGLTEANMYADPTVTNEGTEVYEADPDSTFVEEHTLTLSANATYLVKIIPKDLTCTIVS